MTFWWQLGQALSWKEIWPQSTITIKGRSNYCLLFAYRNTLIWPRVSLKVEWKIKLWTTPADFAQTNIDNSDTVRLASSEIVWLFNIAFALDVCLLHICILQGSQLEIPILAKPINISAVWMDHDGGYLLLQCRLFFCSVVLWVHVACRQ